MTEWPCWTCKYRSEEDTTGFYTCQRPVTQKIAVWERWRLAHVRQFDKTLGTEKQLLGETKNVSPDCPVYERRG